jgi:photosystem II stability/assembly factor-like uncharacterized protein
VFGSGLFRYPVNRMEFSDSTRGIAVGGRGNIWTTSDGGVSWINRESGSPTVPFKVVRTDATHAWSAQSEGEITFTRDGRSWRRSGLPVGVGNVGDLTFANNLEGWAAVNGNTIGSFVYHTTNGGVTWSPQGGLLAFGPLVGIDAVDAQAIVAIAFNQPTVLRSQDGGNTWEVIPHPDIGPLNAIRFVPGTAVGWVVGAGGGIMKTSDGGATWVRQQSHTNGDFLDVSFASVDEGWAVGGTIVHTVDGGATWTPVPSPIGLVFGVSAVGPATVWVAGIQAVARSMNGGASWVAEHPWSTVFFTASFVDAEKGWAAGQDQTSGGPGSIRHREGGKP